MDCPPLFDEVGKKYSPSTKIAVVDSNVNEKNSGIFLGGDSLTGKKYLEVPIQNPAYPIRQSTLDYARGEGVTIIDESGTRLN